MDKYTDITTRLNFDKEISSEEANKLFSQKVFTSEKEMSAFVIEYLSDFLRLLGDDSDIVQVKKEFKPPNVDFPFSYGMPNIRIDLFVITKKENYIIELKNPRNIYTDLRKAIAQCMDYATYMKGCKNVLISSKYNEVVHRLIDEYNLDIEFILFNKENSAIYTGGKNA